MRDNRSVLADARISDLPQVERRPLHQLQKCQRSHQHVRDPRAVQSAPTPLRSGGTGILESPQLHEKVCNCCSACSKLNGRIRHLIVLSTPPTARECGGKTRWRTPACESMHSTASSSSRCPSCTAHRPGRSETTTREMLRAVAARFQRRYSSRFSRSSRPVSGMFLGRLADDRSQGNPDVHIGTAVYVHICISCTCELH